MSRLTWTEALKSGEQIYVRNETDGALVIHISDETSGLSQVNIPKTPIPINLSDLVPRKILENSMDIRHFLNKGALSLVEPTKAERELDTPEAKLEVQRLRSDRFSAKFKDADSVATEVAKVEKMQRSLEIEDNVNIRVKDILLREISAQDKIGLLNAEQMSKEDLEYLVMEAEGKVKQWASKKLEGSQGDKKKKKKKKR